MGGLPCRRTQRRKRTVASGSWFFRFGEGGVGSELVIPTPWSFTPVWATRFRSLASMLVLAGLTTPTRS